MHIKLLTIDHRKLDTRSPTHCLGLLPVPLNPTRLPPLTNTCPRMPAAFNASLGSLKLAAANTEQKRSPPNLSCAAMRRGVAVGPSVRGEASGDACRHKNTKRSED
jgi:hypothetical protein